MPELKQGLKLGNHLLQKVAPSAIRAVDQQISPIPGIIKLTLGEPDFAVPEHVKQATVAAIEADYSHYAPSMGYPELRQAVADYLGRRWHADYAPEEIIVTTGATEAIAATLHALFNPGDTLIVPTPTFPLYAAIGRECGLNVVEVSTAPAFIMTPELLADTLAAHPDAKAMVVNYPGNPTGVTYTQAQIRALAAAVAQTNLLLLSDEIYAELTYNEEHLSLGQLLPAQTVLISGLSKSHAMTGYRVGYVAGPAALTAQIGKMHQYMVTTVASPMQMAALAALRDGGADPLPMRATYKQRRDLVVAGLSAAGFTVATPGGAFYVFAKMPARFGDDDVAFNLRLANEAKVGLVPGSVFGPGGRGYLRLSYAAATDRLTEALRRIQAFCQAN
ncbi:aminotransferase class I/II-fold pyridoxal phosphate-dependent enzyme [Lacticaseibacillus songhuajiangensis]|jgi:aminotransferase|uniref:aminotransferase class I/II-fold pyridoxal phosphate-dependent enzyme n=1 Tax=Lacticaseibacillus songhuajiangensis TaxID=1296539 RepID=UPI000F772779|nr:aminotransferase class I/II-fold pyridoxal phosphate-dependent enzyme [Lacticaseibacillus songhuajiangensis]